MTDQNCGPSNVKLFESTDPIDAAEARALCRACPALAACMKARNDLILPEHEGTWAATTYDPRAEARRRQLDAGKRAEERALAALALADPTVRDTCGVPNGAKHHRANSERVCEPCRTAEVTYKREWRKKRREDAA